MKSDNSRGALSAKIELRRNVLAAVDPARVLDGFSGLGKMWSAVWKDAAGYIGCDSRDWTVGEPHRRYVADNRLVLRCIDLSAWNVFDFDAYGSPWEQMLILAARRQWERGERGAVVLTDGMELKKSFGQIGNAELELLGLGASALHGLPRSSADSGQLLEMLLSKWYALSHVTAMRRWQAYGRGRNGTMGMRYIACVFEGTG